MTDAETTAKEAERGILWTKRTVLTASPEGLRETLVGFERAFDLSSEDFLHQWNAGLLPERQEFFHWYGTCHLAMRMGRPRSGDAKPTQA